MKTPDACASGVFVLCIVGNQKTIPGRISSGDFIIYQNEPPPLLRDEPPEWEEELLLLLLARLLRVTFR